MPSSLTRTYHSGSERSRPSVGVTEISASALRRAHAVHLIAALQVDYSPLDLNIELEKLGLSKSAQGLGIAIVA